MPEGIPQDLGPVVEGLVTVLLATRDAALVPEVVLCAAALPEAPRRLNVWVPERTGARTFANLAETGVAAVVLERPRTHRAVQLKGRCLGVREAAESERPLAERGLGAFLDDVEVLGMAPAAARRVGRWPCRVVTLEVERLYDQTPGPRAGMPYGG